MFDLHSHGMLMAHYGKLECHDEGQERVKIKECFTLESDSSETPGCQGRFKCARHISCTVVALIVTEHALRSWVKEWHSHHEIVSWHSGHVCCAKLLQLCTSLCDPVDHSPLGTCVHGVLHSKRVELVAVPFSRASSQFRDQTHTLTSPALAGRLLTTSATWEAQVGHSKFITSSFQVVLENNQCHKITSSISLRKEKKRKKSTL